MLSLSLLSSQKSQQGNWPELKSGWAEIKVKKTLPEDVSGRHGGVSVTVQLFFGEACVGVVVVFSVFSALRDHSSCYLD